MPEELHTLSEIADAVNAWCTEHGIVPANGQAAEGLNERNIRFYRTAGLVDAPLAGGGRGYGEQHRLQLTAIRVLQAEGLPLRRIRELLFGRSQEDLRAVIERGAAEAKSRHAATAGSLWASEMEAGFILLSRTGRAVPPAVLAAINRLLSNIP